MYQYYIEREVPNNSGFYKEDEISPDTLSPLPFPLGISLFSNINISEMWENALDIAIHFKH